MVRIKTRLNNMGARQRPITTKHKGKKMIDVKTLSAQELSKKKYELSEKIKKTYVAKELAVIEKEIKDRKEAAKKFILKDWKSYGIQDGLIHMPYLNPTTRKKAYGRKVPWNLRVTQPAITPFPTITFDLPKFDLPKA